MDAPPTTVPGSPVDPSSLPIRPTYRGAALLVLVACLLVATASGITALVPLEVGLAVPLGVAPLICRARRRRIGSGTPIRLRIDPAMVALGRRADLHLSVAVPGRWRSVPPIWCDAPRARWTRVAALESDFGTVAPLAPTHGSRWIAPSRSSLLELELELGQRDGPAHATLPVPTGSRGMLARGPIRWWVFDPFALFGCAGPAAQSPTVVVFPPPAPGPPPEPGPVATAEERSPTGETSSHRSGDLGELVGLRAYRAGDRLHSIHWPSRAGPGPLLVREFEPDEERVVRIVLDDRSGVHRRQQFDTALAVTHGLIAESGAAGWTSELWTLCGRRATVTPAPEAAARLLPFLAVLNPGRALDTIPPQLFSGPVTLVTTETARSTLPEGLVDRARVVTV